jgi:hypothetical protein
MQVSTKSPQKSAVFVSVLLGGVMFSSCAASVQPSLNQAFTTSDSVESREVVPPTVMNESIAEAPLQPAAAPRAQLVKKAAMTIIVKSVSESIDGVSQIINQRQGDLIGLDETQPAGEISRHWASITLRVPQNVLENTLEDLAKLGTVSRRNITAEDVGDRLVDLQARLNNLQRTEANLQKIMDRAGSIKDVLSVSQELSRVRESIEQIQAQLKSLQNQVAYSTITLSLEAAVASSSPQTSVTSEMQETWNSSTHSLQKLGIGLIKMAIWLIVYSPVFVILAIAIYSLIRWRRNHAPVLADIAKSTHSD